MCVLNRTFILLFCGCFTSNGNLVYSSINRQLPSATIQNYDPSGFYTARQSHASHANTSSTVSSNFRNTQVNPERNIHGNTPALGKLQNLSQSEQTKNSSSSGIGYMQTLLSTSVGGSSMHSQAHNSTISSVQLAKSIQDIFDKIATYMATVHGNGHPVANSMGYIHSGGHAIGPDKVTIEDPTNGNNGNVNALYQKFIALCQQQCQSGPCPSSCPQSYLGAWSRLVRSVRATKEAWSRIRSHIP